MKQKLQRLKGGRLGSQLFLKTFMLLAFMLSGVGSVWADDVVFGWRMSGTDAPANGETIGGCVGGTITFNSTNSSNSWQTENAEYVQDVPNNYKASNEKALKAGNNSLYIEVTLSEGKFKPGDVITICGYKSWKIGTSPEEPTNISTGLSTGNDKNNYAIASVTIPNGVSESSTIYLARAEGTGTGIASFDVKRPAPTHQSPVATLQCASEINIELGQSVDLKATAEGTGDNNPQVVWNTSDKDHHLISEPREYRANGVAYTITPTEVGEYYYAVRGHQTCIVSGNWEAGDPVFVKVNVTAPAGPYNYSVVAKYNNKTQTLASGSSQTDLAVAYPRYILDGTNLYGIPHNGSGDWWRTTVTAAAPTKELNYTETIDNVVFYTEAEDISGFSSFKLVARASNGLGARSGGSYKNTTSLKIGKYKIVARGVNSTSSARTCKFKVGSDEVYTFSIPNGTDVNGTSTEFEVNSNNTQLSVSCDGSGTNDGSDGGSGLDYFYIVKTGDLTPEVTLTSAASQTINTNQTLSLGVTAKNVGFTTVELYEDAELTTKLGFVGYNNPYTFNPAEGVKRGNDEGGNEGDVLKQGVGTYYLVFKGCNNANGYVFSEPKVYTVTVTAPGVTYELNGGTCDRITDPLNQEVILPRPTKAGHTFIGWMNAAGDITPTAGKAGETKTFNEAKTLYALWYKNNCEIDFTSTGPLKDAPNKAYAYISENGLFMAGGTSMGNVTIDGKVINSRFGVQTGTNWMYYNGGLYQNNSGNRSYGVNGCIAGEYIVINSNTNPNVNAADAELVSHDGNIYTYKVLKDGGVKFTPSRFTYIYTITVSSPCNHTIWADGNVADAAHTAGWWNNFSDYYKISKGQTLNFRFTIHGGEKSRDHWTFYAQSIAKHNGDLGVATTENERVILGADGLRGGTKGWKAISFTRNGTELPRADWNHSLEDWANESKPSDTQFSIDMKHAVVDMTVEYGEDGTMNIVATSVVGTNTYVLRLTSDPIAEETLYLFFTAQNSWMEGIEHPIKFDRPNDNVVITGNGTAVYEQLAKGNPEGTWVKYSVGATTGSAKATVSQINGSNEYQLTVSGRGTVEIIAQCGTQTTTCILTVDGMFFNDPTPVIAHHKTEYTATLNIEDAAGVSYALVEYDTNINGVSLTPSSDNKSVNVNIPTGTEGGVVVVRATKGTAIAEFCLTVAYDKNIWDLYSDPLHYGTVAEGDKTGSRPGSAHYVIFHGDGSYQYEGVTVSKETDPVTGEEVEVETYGDKTDGNRVLFNQYMDRKDYYEKENWFNRQTGTITQGSITKDYDLLRRNWKYTYKTCTYVDGKRTYVNEPLFAFIRPVIGDNARIVKETQGLVFNAAPNAWGVSDNDITNAEGADQSVREADRCILMHTGTSMTVPYVKAGRYVRLHWYRHSTNAGDMFTAENAMDLDGKVINPNDWIRFTGSHYYGHTDEAESTGLYGHKGSAIFYIPTKAELQAVGDTYNFESNYAVDGDGDDCVNFKVTIKNGWTEVYRVEIMDKYMTELKLCQVDCYPEIGTQGGTPYTHRATIENYNAQDINTPSIYNATDHNKIAAKLASRVKTLQATGGNPKQPAHILDAPSLYINGYAGNCYTWNGWQNMALVAENVDGSTSLGFETAREEVAVGNRITYPMYKLYNVHGSGAIKLTLKCISGAINVPEEARYCLNKQEAYVAAGEYSVQEYPYTWDFTKYNMDRGSLAYPEHIGSPMLSNITNSGFNRANAYGRWENKTGNGEIAGLHAAEQQTIKWSAKQSNLNADNYKNTDQPVIGGTSGTIKHIIREQDIRNKRYFAQTSQLTISDGDYRVISETEGLRMSMSAIDDDSNLNKIYFKGVAANGDETTDANPNGYKGKWNNTSLYVDGTITIPEVYEGMYVYIRSPKKPKSVTGAVDYNRTNPTENRVVNSVNVNFYDDNAEVKHMSNDIPDGVWVYKVETGEKKIDLYTGELKSDGEPVSDVVVTLSDEDKTVEAIGVTWFFKPMTQMASNTNDYSTFSTDSRGERIDYNNTKLFTKHHLQAQISTENVVIDDKTYGENGVLGMKNIAVVPAADDVDNFAGVTRGLLLEDIVENRDASITKRPLLPLFVPACNLADQSLDGNCLIAADGDYVEASPKGSQYMNYVFTTQSYSYNWNEGGALTDLTIKDAAFYILRESGNLRKNSAYLKIARPAKEVKQIILVKGEVEGGEATGIDAIETDAEIADLEGADVYTVTGIKVAKPTKKGVYVVNGKKVYVK